MTLVELKNELTENDYETIEQLAKQNYGPIDIAMVLNVDKRAFRYLWRDHDSRARDAYERGRLQFDITKSATINDLISEGNVTAVQIHEKRLANREFEDIKCEIFGF